MLPHVTDTKPTLHADVISTLWPFDNPDGTVTPTWLKVRLEIRDQGVWPFHCHLEYHLYGGLAVLLTIGYNGTWPAAPKNIPSADYNSY